ncbi:four helix bundle protein [Pontiella agarivorans]|uniref:Four helix bundle protein n=1 Tax=Pontiella agarivorans TaxID=3038953 RepID=A0ABU5MT57_9BACT|nr:four helix bundle protein [Pontiella agarivorans]MDZ8117317.1 four helix bundle protein [Pontiella agarivorans]
MTDYQDLVVWQRSVAFVTGVYELTAAFPEDEKFGLTNQMRRAAVSIPSNIAEGSARHHSKDFIHFLRIADGSAAELQTQLLISRNLGFIDNTKINLNELHEIRKMLSGLIKSLRN